MPLDPTGAIPGALIATALNLPPPPTNPTPAEEAQYLAAVAANKATWIAVCSALMPYLIANTVVTVTVTTNDEITIPPSGVATIIAPPSGGPCTGAATGTGTGMGGGTGTIK